MLLGMATLRQQIAAERKMRALLEEGGLPQPDEVEYGHTCIRLLWHDSKAVVVVDIDEPDELALMAAAIAQTVIILAFDEWADSDGAADLEKVLGRKFDLAEQVVSAQTSTAERGRATRGPRKPRS